MAELLVPISPGELIDKITILEIKSARMTDEAKLRNVRTELRCSPRRGTPPLIRPWTSARSGRACAT